MSPTAYQGVGTFFNAEVGGFDTFFDTFTPANTPTEYQSSIKINSRKSLNNNNLPA
jgi:hypothetical protein